MYNSRSKEATILQKLKAFEEERSTLRVYRRYNRNMNDQRTRVSTVYHMGKFDSLTYAVSKVVEAFFRSIFDAKYANSSPVGVDRVLIATRRVADQVLLEISSSGVNAQLIERFVEGLVDDMEARLPTAEEFKLFRQIALQSLQREYGCVYAYAIEDSRDLLLSAGRIEGLNEKVANVLSNDLDYETFKLLADDVMATQRRLVFETVRIGTTDLYFGPGFKNPTKLIYL